MSRATVVWDGLEEYKEQIRTLPAECAKEARNFIEGAVNGAYVTISTVYGQHRVTGNLQKGLKILPLKVSGEYTTGLELRSAAPHAWLFEHGSQGRHYTTVHGVRHVTGRMPPTPIFNGTIGKAKRKLVEQLKDMVIRRGATSVSGE